MRPGTLLRWHALKTILNEIFINNSTILDLGGFDGYISAAINRNKNNKIIVADLDYSGLQQAKDNGLCVLNASATAIPIRGNTIDAVLCLDLIEHVADADAVIAQIARILKPGGVLVLTTPTQAGVTFPFLGKEQTQRINEGWGHLRSGYSYKQIVTMFNNKGLIVNKRSKYFNILSRLLFRIVIVDNKGKFGLWLFRMMLHTEKFIKIGSQVHIIVGEKKA